MALERYSNERCFDKPHLALNLFIYAYKLSKLFADPLQTASLHAEEIVEPSQNQHSAHLVPEE